MVGLLEIAPIPRRVTVGANEIDVVGISAKGIAVLLSRFPELQKLMSGISVGIDELLAMEGDVVGAIIAAGVGFPGNAEQEVAAGRLGLELQVDLLKPILELTMPNGIGPFAEKLRALGTGMAQGVAAGASPTVPPPSSPKPSKS